MQETSTPIAVTELMRLLGNTPDEVAASLLSRGVTGRRYCGATCPVASYLLTNGQPALVGPRLTACLCGRTHVCVDTPQPVADFLNRFDAGSYPYLVASKYVLGSMGMGYAVWRDDGKYAEFLDFAEAEESLKLLASGDKSEGDYEWTA